MWANKLFSAFDYNCPLSIWVNMDFLYWLFTIIGVKTKDHFFWGKKTLSLDDHILKDTTTNQIPQCLLTLVMWSGTLSPVASTGMSSYLLKLMPVLPEPNNSYSRCSSLAVGMVQSTSWEWLSFQRLPPPPPALLLPLPPPLPL